MTEMDSTEDELVRASRQSFQKGIFNKCIFTAAGLPSVDLAPLQTIVFCFLVLCKLVR